MSGRAILTILTALCLWGMYWLYAQRVSPLLEPAPMKPPEITGQLPKPAGPSPEQVPLGALREAQTHLADQPWAATANSLVTTDQTYVYYQDWELVEPEREIRLRPFAMIFRQAPNEEPLTIISDSAVVKFQEKRTSQSGPQRGAVIGGTRMNLLNLGRPVAGRLEGDVLIRGADGLQMHGRNFFYSEAAMRIWSESVLQFAFGKHSGYARGLQIELQPKPRPLKNGELAVAGIHSIRLRRDVHLNLVSDNEANNDPLNLEIESAGGLNYIPSTYQATFEDNVQVQVSQPAEPDQVDTLDCDRLTLLFEEQTREDSTLLAIRPQETAGSPQPVSLRTTFDAEAAAAPNALTSNSSLNPFADMASNLTLRMLWADGRADGRDVKLTSQANNFTAWMSRLVYNRRTNIIALADKERVRVVQENRELRCPQIKLLHDDDFRIISTWCQGTGWLRAAEPEASQPTFVVKWDRQMRTYSDPDSDLDVLQLERRVVLRQPQREMGLAADFVKVWIERTADAGPTTSQGRLDQSLTSSAETFRPRRMLALGNVGWVSPEMEGQTKRLEVWFEEASASDSSPAQQGGEQRGTLFGKGRSDPKEDRTKEPLALSADLVQVRVLEGGTGESVRVAEVRTRGNVYVEQRKAGEPPFVIEGRSMHLQNHSNGQAELHISGNPAHFRNGQAHLEGGNLWIDQARNLAAVIGPGVLRLPVKKTLEGKLLDEPQNLVISWQERMTFDGREIYFLKDVLAILNQNRNRMHCQELLVTLAQQLTFGENHLRQQDLEIQTVECRDNVEFTGLEFSGNKVVEVRRAHFWELSLDQSTGSFTGQGPGWLAVWQRGQSNRAALSPTAVARANQGLESNVVDWEYTRIDFSGNMRGGIKQRYTIFHEDIQVVHGPVESPSETIDPLYLVENSGSMRCQILELSRKEFSPEDRGKSTLGSNGFIQLLARGNVRLEGQKSEGQRFDALADTISFDESKGMYTLRSSGDADARIWLQRESGSPPDRYSAQHMQFAPDSKQSVITGVTHASGGAAMKALSGQ